MGLALGLISSSPPTTLNAKKRRLLATAHDLRLAPRMRSHQRCLCRLSLVIVSVMAEAAALATVLESLAAAAAQATVLESLAAAAAQATVLESLAAAAATKTASASATAAGVLSPRLTRLHEALHEVVSQSEARLRQRAQAAAVAATAAGRQSSLRRAAAALPFRKAASMQLALPCVPNS